MGWRDVRSLALVLGLGSPVPLPAGADAPEFRFQHLGTEEGLSNAWVHAVLKDSRGFLWVGTEDGLNRYDGRSIAVHRRPGRRPQPGLLSGAGALRRRSEEALGGSRRNPPPL